MLLQKCEAITAVNPVFKRNKLSGERVFQDCLLVVGNQGDEPVERVAEGGEATGFAASSRVIEDVARQTKAATNSGLLLTGNLSSHSLP